MVSKRAELFERKRFAKREVEVFREAVVGEIATLERGTSFEGKDRPEVGLGEAIQEPGQAVVALENILTDALVVTCGEAVREERYVSLGYHLGAPHGQQFFGRNIQLEAPLGYVGSFARKGWVEGMVGSGKGVLERLRFRGCGDAEEFEQIAQSTADQADVQSIELLMLADKLPKELEPLRTNQQARRFFDRAVKVASPGDWAAFLDLLEERQAKRADKKASEKKNE
jgi:hypothetical protein